MDRIGPEHKYLEINKLRFHYLDWGGPGRPVVLLLHGFLGHAQVWEDFALEFMNQYHVLALDQRGHGLSERPREPAYSLDDHFSDLCRFTERLFPDRLTLIGHSMGGRNALFYAACFPEKIDRLVIVDSRPGDNRRSRRALMRLLESFPLETDSLETVVESLRTLYPLVPLETARRMVRHGYQATTDGKYIPRFDARMTVQSQESGYYAENLWPLLGGLVCPTLVIRGEQSPFLSRPDARAMVDQLPNGVLREISCSTHLPVEENPEEFNAAVRIFLDAGRRATARG